MNTLRNYPEFRDHPLADMAAAEVSKRLEGYVQSTFLHELTARVAEERGVDVPDIHDEASFFDAAQLAFDFRNGKAREDISVADLSEGTKQQLHELIDAFAMRRETEPTEFGPIWYLSPVRQVWCRLTVWRTLPNWKRAAN